MNRVQVAGAAKQIGLIIAALFMACGLLIDTVAQECQDLVPELSRTNVAVSSSGNYASSGEAWMAFDASLWSFWLSELWEAPAWISYDFGADTLVNLYRITFTNGAALASRAPKAFALQGGGRGKWVVLDSRSNQTGWTIGKKNIIGGGVVRSYNVMSPGSYSNYRLVITEDNDSRAKVVLASIGNLELIHSTLNAALSCEVFSKSIQCSSEINGGVPPYSYRWSYSGTASAWSGDEEVIWAIWLGTTACVGKNIFTVWVTDACGAIYSTSRVESCGEG